MSGCALLARTDHLLSPSSDASVTWVWAESDPVKFISFPRCGQSEGPITLYPPTNLMSAVAMNGNLDDTQDPGPVAPPRRHVQGSPPVCVANAVLFGSACSCPQVSRAACVRVLDSQVGDWSSCRVGKGFRPVETCRPSPLCVELSL